MRKTVIALSVVGVVLAVIVGVLSYLLFGGHVKPGAEGRLEISLPAGERAVVLKEMRDLLAAVQAIVAAATRDDPVAIAAAARPLGMQAAQHVEVALEAKLPMDFLKRGRDLHQDFDRIADDAERRKDTRRSLVLLGETLNKCVACHAAYALVPAASGTPAAR